MAMAFELGAAEITDASGAKVTKVSPNNAMLVNIQFTYTLDPSEEFDEIRVDARGIYPSGIYSGADYSNLKPASCSEVEGTSQFLCKIKGLTLKVSNTSIKIKVLGKYSNTENVQNIENETTISIATDSTNPQVSFLGTDTCAGKVCYIRSNFRNHIMIVMKDESATFNKGNVGFRIGGKNELVDLCDGMSCNGSTKITCEDNQRVALSLRHDGIRSRDDLGNKIDGAPTELVCISTPPSIESYSFASGIGTDTLVIGKDMILSFNVTDLASPTVQLTIDAQNIAAGNVSANCSKIAAAGADFNCRAVLKSSIDRPGEYEIQAYFTDITGMQTKVPYMLKILQSTNETINLWKVSGVQQSSDTFSRPNLDYERTLFARINLESAAGASIIDIKPAGTCIATDNSTGTNSDIVSVRMVNKQDKSIYVKVALRENNDGRYDKINYLEYHCPITISSKKGNYYYGSPEQDNFTIKITLKDDKSISQIHQQEIDKYTKLVQQNFARVDKIQQVVTYAQGICSVCTGISTVNSVIGTSEATLAAIPPAYGAANALGKISDGLSVTRYKGICKEATGVCNFMTCSGAASKLATNGLNNVLGSDSSVYKLAGYNDFASTLNPYKSYVVAAATMCLPAVAYHMNTFAGIQCSYLDCISNDYVKYGQDISTCQQDKAFSECMYFSGGVLDAVPFVSMFRDVSSRVGNMMKDPVQLFGFAYPFACKAFNGVPAVQGVCVASQEVMSAMKSVSKLNEMMEQISRMIGNRGASNNCASVLATAQSSDFKYRQLNKIGGQDEEYTTEKTIDGGKMTCAASECLYEKPGAQPITIKILRDENENPKEAVYYYGDKKIQMSRLYDDNIKDVPLEESIRDFKEYKETRTQELKDQLAQLDRDEQQATAEFVSIYETQKKMVNKELSELDTPEAYLRYSDIMYKGLELKLKEAAFKASAESRDRWKATATPEMIDALDNSYKSELALADLLKKQVKQQELEAQKEELLSLQKLQNSPKLSKTETARMHYLQQKYLSAPKMPSTTGSSSEIEQLQAKADEAQAEFDEQSAGNPNFYNSEKFTQLKTNLDAANQALEQAKVSQKLPQAPIVQPNVPEVNYEELISDANSRVNSIQRQINNAEKATEGWNDEDIHTDAEKGMHDADLKAIRELRAELDKENAQRDNYVAASTSANPKPSPESAGQVQKQIDEVNKQINKDLKKDIRDAKRINRKASTALGFQTQFGTWTLASMKAWGNAQTIAGMRTFLNMNWGTVNPKGKMAQAADFLIEDVGQFERSWCENKIKPQERLGDTVVMNSMGGDIFSTGAQVGGRKAGPINDGTKVYYEYWIQGNVITNKNDGLGIKIALYDAAGKEYDITSKYATDVVTLSKGSQFTFGRSPAAEYFTDTINYDKICILFDGPLNAYFDHVSGGNSDRICQKIVLE